MKNKVKFKFNSGMFALVCSNCSRILKTGSEFSEDEWKSCKGEKWLPPQHCDICKEKTFVKKYK
jgi:hypothetical protein